MHERVLVTGAGGFVGRSIMAALLAADYRVIAVDRAFDAALRARWAGRVTFVTADAADLPTLAFDSYIHGAALTASPAQSGMSAVDHLRANLDPALHLLENSRHARRGIFISSSAVFEHTAPGTAITERTPAQPLGTYAVAKHTLESLIATLRAENGTDVLAIRLSNVYGPEETTRASRPNLSTVGQMLHTALEDGHITVHNPEEARDWTYAPDIGRAVVALLAAPVLQHPLYHVASGEALTMTAIAAAIQQHLPQVTVGEGERRAPHPRQGTVISERLYADTGFDGWTPFHEGIRQIIQASTSIEA